MAENRHPAKLASGSVMVEDFQERFRQLNESSKASVTNILRGSTNEDRTLQPSHQENVTAQAQEPRKYIVHKGSKQSTTKDSVVNSKSIREQLDSLKLDPDTRDDVHLRHNKSTSSESDVARTTTTKTQPEKQHGTTNNAHRKGEEKLQAAAQVQDDHSPSNASQDTIQMSNSSHQRFKLDDFLIGRPLGRGRFGSVYLAQTKVGKRIVALKILYKDHLKKEKVTAQLKREIEIHSRLKHENVIRLHSYFHDEKRVFLVLEYAPGGELFTAMRNAPEGRFDERRAATVMKQLFRALRKCQKYQVVHRDIKPENILIGRNNRIKLADFGWSVNNTDSESMKRRTMCGTVEYIPPEMVHEQAYDERVDIWGAGVLMYEMLVGRSPFTAPGAAPFVAPDEGDTMWRVVNCEVQMPGFLSSEAKDLISKLVVKEPEKRLPIKFALQHPWIQKYADPDDE